MFSMRKAADTFTKLFLHASPTTPATFKVTALPNSAADVKPAADGSDCSCLSAAALSLLHMSGCCVSIRAR